MKLFPKEYGQLLQGKSLCIAIQSDNLLKECKKNLLDDLKYLLRFKVKCNLLHTFADIKEIEDYFYRQANVLSLYSNDFEAESLRFAYRYNCKKLIFICHKPLTDHNGDLIDTITVNDDLKELASRLNITSDIKRIKQILHTIKQDNSLKHVQIISGRQSKSLRNELLSMEGVGTLITEFINTNFLHCTKNDTHLILNLLKPYVKLGNVLPRNYDYIQKKIDNFFKVTIDGILAGCVEIIRLNDDIVELGALVSVGRFLEHRVGKALLTGMFKQLKQAGYKQTLVVTKNQEFSRSLVRFYNYHEIEFTDIDIPLAIKNRMQRSSYARFFMNFL